MKRIKISLPLAENVLENLEAGDLVSVDGVVYTARDAAHQRLVEAIESGRQLPFELKGQAIYYTGPCPAPPGRVIGSIGPTTSSRMDPYTPLLIQKGLSVMIGKGLRSDQVIKAMVEHKAVYLGATGGAGALLSQQIKSAQIIAYPDLGTEAILKLELENFPAVVLIDSRGQDLYKTGRASFG